MNWRVIFHIAFVSAITFACQKSDSPDQKEMSQLVGRYSGHTDNGEDVTFKIYITKADSFIIREFRGVTYPFVDLMGKLDGQYLTFQDHSCIDCPFLPSPGGVKRFYTAHLSASGQCESSGYDVVIDIDYLQTGDYTGSYQGKIYMNKN